MAMEVFKLVGRILFEGGDKTEKEIEKIEKKLQEVGEGFKTTGEKMSSFLTVPLVALGGGAIASAIGIESAGNIIDASFEGNAEKAKQLNESAKALWTQGFGTDLAQVATNISDISVALGDVHPKELEEVTKSAMALEQRFGEDMQGQMRAVSALMKSFGMTATEAMDYLTVGFKDGLNYSGEFTDTIAEYSTYFGEFGFTADDMFSKFKSGAESGAFQLDKVGDAMKEFTLRSKDGSKTSSDGFKAIGLNALEMTTAFNKGGQSARDAFDQVVTALQNTDDEQKRNAASVALFGTQYEDLGKEGFDAFLKMSEGMENVGGASQRFAEEMNRGLGVELTSAWRQLQVAIEPLGTALGNLISVYLPPLLEKLQALGTWFSKLDSSTQLIIIGFGAFMAVLGPAIVVIGMLITNLMPVIGVLKKVRLAMMGVNLAFLANPITWIIIGIVALIAIGIALYKNWDTVKAKLMGLWNKLGSFKGMLLGLLGPFGLIVGAGISLYKNWDKVKEKLGQFKTFVVNKIKETATGFLNKFNEMKSGAQSRISGMVNTIKSTASKITSAVVTPVQNAWNKAKTWIDKIKNAFNFKWSLPKLKVPSVSIRMAENSWGVPYPKFSVRWNQAGAFFDKPTVLQGLGERGREAIIPTENARRMKPFSQAIADNLKSIFDFGQDAGNRTITIPVILNGREIARAIATDVDQQLGSISRRKARARGVNPL